MARIIVFSVLTLVAVLNGASTTAADTTNVEQATPAVHFHHVHLNVTDPKATIAFYQKFFGATEVRYRGLSAGLFTERSFILLSKVAAAP